MPKFKLKGSDFNTALNVVTKCIGAAPETLAIKAHKDKLEIKAYSNQLTISVTIDAETEDLSEFSAPIDRLKALTSKRGPMIFGIYDQMMRYKALTGAYKGDMVINGYTPIDMAFDPKLPKLPTYDLAKYLTFVDLVPIIEKDIILFINVKNGVITLATGDNYHAGMVSFPDEGLKDSQTAIPIAYQKLFASIFGKEKYTLYSSESHLFARSDVILLQLPLMDAGDITFDLIKNYIDTAVAYTGGFSHEGQAVKEVLDNMGSINDNSKSVKLNLKNNSLVLSMQSSIGRSSDELQVTSTLKDSTVQINLNYKMFNELISKLSKAKRFDLFVIEKSAVKLTAKLDDASIIYVAYGVTE